LAAERCLMVASGGSGDLVTACALGGLPSRSRTVALATPVWERHALDPRPGPRSAATLRELRPAGGCWVITAHTWLPGGYSPLSALAAGEPAPVYFLDLAGGAPGVADQLRRIVRRERVDLVQLVDTGGDVLAQGREPTLVSPTMDALLLAAAASLAIPVLVTVTGLGLDGELTPAQLDRRMALLPRVDTCRIDRATAAAAYRRHAWFPSEASLMTLLAAMGYEGWADIHADASPVHIDPAAAAVHRFPVAAVARASALVPVVAPAPCLEQAVEALRGLGVVTEIDHERARAAGSTGDEVDIARLPDDLRVRLGRASTFVTLRRLGRLLGMNHRAGLRELERWLMQRSSRDYRRPLFRTVALG
jgi:hypothetical protein